MTARPTASAAEIQMMIDLAHAALRWHVYGCPGSWWLDLCQQDTLEGWVPALEICTARKSRRIFSSLDTVLKYTLAFNRSPDLNVQHIAQMAMPV